MTCDLSASPVLEPDVAVIGWEDLTGKTSPGWPVAFWRHHPMLDQDAGSLAEATLALQRDWGLDIVKVTPAGTFQAVDHGLKDGWQGDPQGRRAILSRPVVEPADWERVIDEKVPGPMVSAVLAATRQVAAGLGDGPILLQTVFNPLTVALQLAGPATLRRHMTDAPAVVEAALARLASQTAGWVRRLPGLGVDGIYLATQSMSRQLFSPAEYARWGGPGDRACVEAAARLPYNVFHVHGEDAFFSLPPLAGRRWAVHYELSAANPPLETLLDVTDCTIMPGVCADALRRADTPQKRGALLSGLRDRLAGRPAILSAGCTLPLDVPAETVRAWRDAALNWS